MLHFLRAPFFECLPNKSATASRLQLGQNDIPAPGRYDMKSVLEKGAVRMSFGLSAMIMLWGS